MMVIGLVLGGCSQGGESRSIHQEDVVDAHVDVGPDTSGDTRPEEVDVAEDAEPTEDSDPTEEVLLDVEDPDVDEREVEDGEDTEDGTTLPCEVPDDASRTGKAVEQGGRCGTCESGRWQCRMGTFVCEGDGGESALNACGSCGLLPGEPEASCGECATWLCEGGELVCALEDSCASSAACDALGCGDLARSCLTDTSPVVCGVCLEGYVEVDGVCVESAPESCEALDCRAQRRVCREGPPARCGPCFWAYEEVDGECLRRVKRPRDIVASVESSSAHVVVTWTAVEGATHYRIYRDGAYVSSVDAAPFLDTEAPLPPSPGAVNELRVEEASTEGLRLVWSPPEPLAGALASYQVRTVQEDRMSRLSAQAEGSRAPLPVDRYRLTWDDADSALEVESTAFQDADAPRSEVVLGAPVASRTLPLAVRLSLRVETSPPMERAYRVAAIDSLGRVGEAVEVVGTREAGEIHVTWERSEGPRGPWTTLDVEGVEAEDLHTVPGEPRWYRARVLLTEGDWTRTTPAVEGVRWTVGAACSANTECGPREECSPAGECVVMAHAGMEGAPCTEDADCTPGLVCPTRPARPAEWPPIVPEVAPSFCAPSGWQFIPAGTYERGAIGTAGEASVTLTRGFLVEEVPLTRGRWRVAFDRPGYPAFDPSWGAIATEELGGVPCTSWECPVERVNWYEALAFANYQTYMWNMEHPDEPLSFCYDLRRCGLRGFAAGCGDNFCCLDAIGPGPVASLTGVAGNAEFEVCGLQQVYRCPTEPSYSPGCTGFRIPTEAEWEVMMRCGVGEEGVRHRSPWPCGDDPECLWSLTWMGADFEGGETREVATLLPNDCGIYDVLGNVWEWLWDWDSSGTFPPQAVDPLGATSGTLRGFRGAIWGDFWQSSLPDIRHFIRPTYRGRFLGMRLVRTVAESNSP